MSDQLNIPFGVDMSRVMQAANQGAALAGKLFGKKFKESAEQEAGNVEIQIEIDVAGAQQLAETEKDARGLVKILNMSADSARKQAAQMDKMALASKKAANSQKMLRKAIGNNGLKAMPDQLRKSIKRLKELQKMAKKGSKEFNRLGKSIKKMQERLNKMNGGTKKISMLDKAMNGLTGKFTLANVAANYLTRTFDSTFQSVVRLFDAMDQRAMKVEALALAMKNAGVDGKELDAVMRSIKATALTYGVSIEDVSAAWKRLAPTILAAGGTLKDAEDVIVSMSARVVSLGLNSEQTGRYMEALAQVIGKGKLQGEELTKQLSQLDGALRSQIEEDLKNTVKGFTNLQDEMKNGAVTADMFTKSFIKVSENAVKTLATDMQKLNTKFSAFNKEGNITLAQMQNKIGALNTMSLDNITGSLDSLSKMSWRMSADWAKAILKITSQNKEFMSSVKDLADSFSFVAEQINRVIVLLAMLKSYEKQNPVGQANNFLSTSFLLGGPMALGQLAMQIPLVRDQLEKASKQSDEFFESMTEVENLNLGFLESTIEKVNEELAKSGSISEETAKQMSEAYKEQVKTVDTILARLKEIADEEKRVHQERIEVLEQQRDAENELHRDTKDLIKQKYDEQKEALDDIRQKLIDNYEIEKGELNKKTDAERRLEELRKKELKARANNASLSEKERLQAQASLDQMHRRDKLLALETKHKQEQKALDDAADRALKLRDGYLKGEDARHKSVTRSIKDKIDAEKKGIKEIQKGYQDLKTEVENAKLLEKKYIDLNKTAALEAINSEISRLDDLAAAYARARSAGNGGGDGPPNTWTGGPVTGGELRTVNEFGKEAFLSASGKLSMINAPAWGEWRAPSHGTIIPAHLTKQLDIPKGGINLNSAARATAAKTSGNGNIASAIRGISARGDNFNNSVTIQAHNPVQAANSMMVQLHKIRRGRLGR